MDFLEKSVRTQKIDQKWDFVKKRAQKGRAWSAGIIVKIDTFCVFDFFEKQKYGRDHAKNRQNQRAGSMQMSICTQNIDKMSVCTQIVDKK